MLDDIHDYNYQDGKSIRQFDEYLEINSQDFTNFKPIPEYHANYEEFPTINVENVTKAPEEEEEREKDRDQDRQQDSSSSEGSSSSSSVGSSSGSVSSSAGSSAASSSSALASVSASTVISTAFVTLVAVSSVILPIVENADLDADLQVEYSGSILAYVIELSNMSEGSNYYVVVMEDQTVLSEKLIVGGFQSDTISGLNGAREHRVEVRTGTPPLYSVASTTIPGQPIWVEWGDVVVDYHNIDFTITLHGYEDVTTASLRDPETGATVYSQEITEGPSSGHIGGLKADHGYEFTVSSASHTYISTTLNTKPPQVTVDHITIEENNIDYGILVEGDVPLTLSLYDTETMATVYTSSLSEGMNPGTIEKLEFEHSYQMTVSSDKKTYLTESITTEPALLEIEVTSLELEETTLSYVIEVKGNAKIATLALYEKDGEQAVFSEDLEEGTNTGTVADLKYGQEYTLTIFSGDVTYVTEEIVTDIKAEIISLKAVENAVEYSIDVKTSSKVVTMHLFAGEALEEITTLELKDGTNTGRIGELDHGQLYTVTVTCDDKTYATQTVTTDIKVEVKSLEAKGNTVSYEIDVKTKYKVATMKVYLSSGKDPVYTKKLEDGTNSGTVYNLEYLTRYRIEISDEDKTYVTKYVTTEDIATILTAVNGQKLLSIVELNSTRGITVGLYSDMSCTEPVSDPVRATGLVKLYVYDVEFGQTYYVGVKDENVDELEVSSVHVTENEPLSITDDGKLHYEVNMMNGYTGTAYLKDVTTSTTVTLTDLEGDYEGWSSGHTYTLQLRISEVSTTVDLYSLTPDPQVTIEYTVDGETIEYNGTTTGATDALSIYLYKSGISEYIAKHDITEPVKGNFRNLENGATYTLYVNKTGVSDPTSGYYWKSEDIKISTVSIDAHYSGGQIVAEVTFATAASSDGKIGLYYNIECTSEFKWVSFASGTTSFVVSFQCSADTYTYYIGVYIGSALEAVKSITVT